MTSSENKSNSADWTCSICLELARDPAVTPCGHLFCWKCLYRWIEKQPSCPNCNGEVRVDDVIPIYGRGRQNASHSNTNDNDLNEQKSNLNEQKSNDLNDDSFNNATNVNSNDIPNRPRGHRRDSLPRNQGTNWETLFTTFGIPFFSFEFGSVFNQNNFRYSQLTPQQKFDEDFTKYLMIGMGLIILLLISGFL